MEPHQTREDGQAGKINTAECVAFPRVLTLMFVFLLGVLNDRLALIYKKNLGSFLSLPAPVTHTLIRADRNLQDLNGKQEGKNVAR